jgi:hypothetical protein
LTVRVVWERNYLTKEMVPQDLSSDFLMLKRKEFLAQA